MRLVSRAETWERVYEALENINFAAFDYNNVKQSLLDYIKLYFPETFNDYIETSELVAIIETFAYIAEQMAYRIDVTSHENFISTAQRRDSLLRLAKLVSYTASRPLPARGFVKITSVSTTEKVLDVNGNSLANTTVRWNDASNSGWKDQFLLIMNRVLEQGFGSVGPNDRFQIQDVVFEMYGLNLIPQQTGVFKYTAAANNSTVNMELVSIEYDSSVGIKERRPYNGSNFTLVYANDGLGDQSETTGFLCFTKQGLLQRYRTTFDGVTPNQFYDVPVDNVNDTDVWLNNVDSTTGATLDLPNPLAFRPSWYGKSGEWLQVDPGYAQNVIFNTNPNRNKYEVETRDSNRVRLIFGDGEYADVPAGTFDVWVRTSEDEDIIVPQTSVTDTPITFTYVDAFGKVQTFTFTVSLIGTLQNASAAETNEHIRTTAPAVYYTQDRMVNGQDYNTFMLQDPSILKLRSINRTFAGDSQYIPWHDASQTYENVKVYGDDGIVYFQEKPTTQTTGVIFGDVFSVLISNFIEPLISSTDILLQLNSAGVPYGVIRSYLTTIERSDSVRGIEPALTAPPDPSAADMYYYYNPADLNDVNNGWHTVKTSDGPTGLPGWPVNYITTPLISIVQLSSGSTSYNVTRQSKRLVFESQTTTFWNTNSADGVVDYDTLSSTQDVIVVLKANVNSTQTGVLQQAWKYNILGQEVVDSGTNLGLEDVHRLSILPYDENNDGTPDNLDPDASSGESVADYFNYKMIVDISNETVPLVINLPVYYVVSGGVVTNSDISVTSVDGDSPVYAEVGGVNQVVNQVKVVQLGSGAGYQIVDLDLKRRASQRVDVILPPPVPLSSVVEGNIPSALPANTYDFNVIIDGGLSQELSIITLGGESYEDLALLMNAVVVGGEVTYEYDVLTGGAFVVTSSATSLPSSVVLTNGTLGSSGGNLFTAIAAADGVVVVYGVPSEGTTLDVGSPTGLVDSISQVYNATVTVDGGTVQPISIVGSAAQTYGELVEAISLQLSGAYAAFVGGDIRIISSSYGSTSTVGIVDVDLFSSLTDFVVVDSPVIGDDLSVTPTKLFIKVNDYVYFSRDSAADSWLPVETSYENISAYVDDMLVSQATCSADPECTSIEPIRLCKRYLGRNGLNFAWFHYAPRYHLVDPTPSNIIDTFIITKGYYMELKRWLEDSQSTRPSAPTPFSLRSSYGYLLDNKMISDTVILHPGKIKLLFGANAASELQAKFKVIRSQNGVLTDNQVKTTIVTTIRNFFDITLWEFGETFYFTELAAAIHAALPTEISSVVLIPSYTTNQFGDMFQLLSREDEIFYPDITVDQIEVVTGFTATNLRLNG